MYLSCFSCEAELGRNPSLHTCPKCGSVLEVRYREAEFARVRTFEGRGVWRYAPLLPAKRVVTLGEGDTGLHACERLGRAFRVPRLFVKNEGENPTGSFKDRGMTVGIAMARSIGARTVACASTGNTAASMAAYAARSGITALVLVPAGKVALGKIAQSVAHGARIAEVEGNFDDAMRLVMELSHRRRSVYLLNSINPFRLEGQKTLAFEVCEALGDAPDCLVLPMGNAGNISAIWKGFKEWHRIGRIRRLPRIIGVQAEGSAPIVKALRERADGCRVEKPRTVATAIRIGAPVNWKKAVAALVESGGEAGTVSDREILEAQRELARKEGIFVEPASAAPIAYLRKRRLRKAHTVVCVTTGHGLKDPGVMERAPVVRVRVKPTLDSLRRLLER